MGVFSEMKAANLIDAYSLYNGEMKDYKGELVERLMVDIEYKGNTITLFSESPFTESEQELALALDHTFFHSVKLAGEKKSIAVNRSAIFSNSTTSINKTYYADRNAIYTPEAIYCCEKSWLGDEPLYDRVLGLSAVSRSIGLTPRGQELLKELGAIKLINFKDDDVEEEVEEKTAHSLYNKLIAFGAKEVSKLEYSEGREEDTGYRYEGRAVLEFGGFTLDFEMWHLHNSEEPMTRAEVIANLPLRRIKIKSDELSKLFPDYSNREGTHRFSVEYNTFIYRDALFFTPFKFSNESISGKRIAALKARVKSEGLTEQIIVELKLMDFKRII